MPPSNSRSGSNMQESLSKIKPSVAFVVLIFGALIAFEIFNYTTTDHALGDLLGDLTFAGIPWSTILALAFCGIDFAGIARLFTPEQGADEPKEVWYLFAAWLLAATMNAILTWWGVSLAVANRNLQSSAVIDPGALTSIVPVFVAIMVWVIRILIIGTLSLSMDRLLHPGAEQRTPLQNAVASRQNRHEVEPTQAMKIPSSYNSAGISSRPSMSRAASGSRGSRTNTQEEAEDFIPESPSRSRPDPTYHSLSMSSRPPLHNSGSNSNENTGAHRFRRS